ncbi:MAG: pilus biogenesis protein [Candidatus Tectimicrobiota bacterium]|nr:MAG: pilus biogenesis protein [Candidatus Tectomicrobia bacterium]
MILTDAGPLVALLDRGEPDHGRCQEALTRLRGPLLTTWPAFTEAMYLLGEAGGWRAQEALWRLLRRGDLVVEMPRQLERMASLMSQYRSLPMDLADASLVALAEERGLTTVFTLDHDFYVYRLPRGKAFTLIP